MEKKCFLNNLCIFHLIYIFQVTFKNYSFARFFSWKILTRYSFIIWINFLNIGLKNLTKQTEEILKQIWPVMKIKDGMITQCISNLIFEYLFTVELKILLKIQIKSGFHTCFYIYNRWFFFIVVVEEKIKNFLYLNKPVIFLKNVVDLLNLFSQYFN